MADLTLEDVKELLGTQSIPGSPEELEVLTEWTQGVVRRKGPRYVRKNRKRLFRDWEFMRKLGLSRV
jgi:hypothetical protein